jgi:hypothetical protein
LSNVNAGHGVSRPRRATMASTFLAVRFGIKVGDVVTHENLKKL